jgi:mannitol-1-/sugar-/sorbitol-6-phosphatase
VTEDPAAPRHARAGGGSLPQGRSRDLTLPARGLLFDNDGVLVDSDAAVTTSWSRWALEQGLDPVHVMAVVHGRRAADTVADLVAEGRRDGATALIDRYELEDAGTVPAVAGAADLLAALPAHVWAVVTSGTPALATARLTAAGLPLPGAMVTGHDVRVGKPDPEAYLLGARLLGLPPADTVVVEDSPAGVAAGRAAGARVLGVGERALGTGADVVVRDLRQLRWADGVLTVAAGAVLQAGG